jgi:tagatose 6-phosphate kinase
MQVILTVTMNAAFDVTYELDSVNWKSVNRVRTVRNRAGGKGINVARLLKALGRRVTVSGLAGGATGAALRAELSKDGIADALVPIAGESRRTLAIVTTDGATLLNEPGPTVSVREWRHFFDHFTTLVEDAQAVVLSGSLPPGIPLDAYAFLGKAARSVGIPVVLDTSGRALIEGLVARPVVVKPNKEELASATGLDEAWAATAALRRTGAENVVASLGDRGLLADTTEGCWRAVPPRHLAGNATGAGDAVVAALVAGLVDESPWPRRLVEATALSAASVIDPVAGSADLEVYRQFRQEVTLESCSR